jgi:hypothetical protein
VVGRLAELPRLHRVLGQTPQHPVRALSYMARITHIGANPAHNIRLGMPMSSEFMEDGHRFE